MRLLRKGLARADTEQAQAVRERDEELATERSNRMSWQEKAVRYGAENAQLSEAFNSERTLRKIKEACLESAEKEVDELKAEIRELLETHRTGCQQHAIQQAEEIARLQAALQEIKTLGKTMTPAGQWTPLERKVFETANEALRSGEEHS